MLNTLLIWHLFKLPQNKTTVQHLEITIVEVKIRDLYF